MITKKTNLIEVLNRFPETIRVFQKHGFHCVGCQAASFESIEEAAKAHNINADELVKELNTCVQNNKCGIEGKEE